MRRLLVVRCPALLVEDDQGRAGRQFADMVAAIRELTPVVDVVAPGVGSLLTRGPSRYFGGDRALAALVAATAAQRCGHLVGVGVADGLFAAVLAATTATGRGSPVVVDPGATAAFLAPWPVAALDRPELASVLDRLGVHRLGQLAALPRHHVLARFGTDGAACHDVATGRSGELAGMRRPVRYRGAAVGPPTAGQAGFWGVDDGAARRARQATAHIAATTGPTAVLVGQRHDGRSPCEWDRLVPWDADGGVTRRHDAAAPWPGRIPRPAPALVHRRPLRAELVDASDRPVGVSSHGEATAAPARLSVDGSPWQRVLGWAGPWPVDERWWAARRRRAHLQVLAAAGAHLLVREHRCWWVEATYD